MNFLDNLATQINKTNDLVTTVKKNLNSYKLKSRKEKWMELERQDWMADASLADLDKSEDYIIDLWDAIQLRTKEERAQAFERICRHIYWDVEEKIEESVPYAYIDEYDEYGLKRSDFA